MDIFLRCLTLLVLCKSSTSARTAKIHYEMDSWMGSLSPLLNNRKLSEIVIPGTHNSGSYPITVGSRISDLNQISDFTDGAETSPLIMNIVRKAGPGWAKCQDHSIGDQLRRGNRYLDLRVYCDRETDEYYLEHFFIGSNLTEDLLHIAQFVEERAEEVVILDLRSEQNCTDLLMIRLLERIGRVFGEKLVPAPIWDDDPLPTYGQLVADGTTVVVSVKDNHGKYQGFDWLWNSRAHMIDPFADTASKEQLRSFIADEMSKPRPPRSLFVAQIILSPTTDTFVDGLTGAGAVDLREFARDLNRDFQYWIKDLRQLNPNIFMTDFPSRTLVKKIINMNFYQDKVMETRSRKVKSKKKGKKRGKKTKKI